MSKEVKQLSPLKRGLRIFGLVFGGGALFGVAMGFFAGFFHGYFDEAGYNFETVKEAVLWFSRSAAVILLLAAIVKVVETKRFHAYYLATDEDDEDLVDNYYRATFRSLEMGTVFYNIAATLVVLSLVLSQYLFLSSDGAEMFISGIEYLFLLVLVIMQVVVLKLTQKVRNYKLSAFATVKEIKGYVDSLDEGERQANLERAFLTVFNLNQIVLPALYLVVYFISVVSQTQQLVAYLVIATIHIYINVMQIHSIRQYFK